MWRRNGTLISAPRSARRAALGIALLCAAPSYSSRSIPAANSSLTTGRLSASFTADGVEIRPSGETPGDQWQLRIDGFRPGVLGEAGVVMPSLPDGDGTSVAYRRREGTESWSATREGLSVRLDPRLHDDRSGWILGVHTELELRDVTGGVAFLHRGRPVVSLRSADDGWRVGLSSSPALTPGRRSVEVSPVGSRGSTSPTLQLRALGSDTALADEVLATVPHWIVESNRSAATFGAAVATVGDVNGDGYSDVVVGSPTFASGELDEGRAFLYRGSADGLSTAPSWTIESNVVGARLGSAVAPAGDVNGDGYADFLVAADALSAEVTNGGRVLLFLGSADGPSTTPDWTADGSQQGERFGSSIAPAGDVDGDGYDDVIVGAPFHDGTVADEGRAVLYLGSPAGLEVTAAWSVLGAQDNAQFGSAVAGVGDLDGDGHADVAVGAPAFNGVFFASGRVFLFRGAADGPAAMADWTADGDTVFSSFGAAIAPIGDAGGDGHADFAVGAPTAGTTGKVHVFVGAAGEPLAGPVLGGPSGSEQFGATVATAGDVNGDGYADLLVGDPLYADGELDEGGAFLFLGSANGLSTGMAWQVESDEPNASFGAAVGTAGDVDGDGRSDVIIGAPRADNGQADEGRAFSYLGSTTPPGRVPGWEATGFSFGELFAGALDSAGDVNADGFSDVIVGAPFYAGGQSAEGRALVYLGSSEGLGAGAHWTFEPNLPVALAGRSVAGVGDVNGDGYADVAVGAPNVSGTLPASGRVYLFLGPLVSGQAPDWHADGSISNGGFGLAISGAGDVNGDGLADLLIGAPGPIEGQPARGRAELYLGTHDGLAQTAAWSYEGSTTVSRFGSAVASAGDVNGDGFGDVVIGAPTVATELIRGEVLLFLGSVDGLSREPVWRAESSQSRSLFGSSVAGAGDIDGDGFSDVVIGENNFSGGELSEGRASLYLGSPAGLSGTPIWEVVSAQANALLGSDVSAAGDVDADGYGDLLIGLAGYTDDFEREGQARIYLGGPDGPSTTAVWSVTGRFSDAKMGDAVSFAGDVDGDGAADVVVGAPQHFGFRGLAQLYSGNRGPGRALPITQRRLRTRRPLGIGSTVDGVGAFRMHALAASPAGRARVGLEWEARPVGTVFGGTSPEVEPLEDTGAPTAAGSVTVANVVADGLEAATALHWRARYRSASPFFPHSIWRSAPHLSMAETRFRTAGVAPAPAFGLIGPAANELVFPDAIPLIFSWLTGGLSNVRLAWSLNPEFVDALVTSPTLSTASDGAIAVYRPDDALWLQILRLAAGSPEIRDVPVFWRIEADGAPTPDLRVLRIAAARAPEVTFPPDGSEFLAIQPPTLIWEPNHTEAYRIVFAADASLSGEVIETSAGYDLTEPIYDVPDALWARIVELAGSSGNQVHYVVFARDSLDRITWSRTRTLRIIQSSATLGSSPPGGKRR